MVFSLTLAGLSQGYAADGAIAPCEDKRQDAPLDQADGDASRLASDGGRRKHKVWPIEQFDGVQKIQSMLLDVRKALGLVPNQLGLLSSQTTDPCRVLESVRAYLQSWYTLGQAISWPDVTRLAGTVTRPLT